MIISEKRLRSAVIAFFGIGLVCGSMVAVLSTQQDTPWPVIVLGIIGVVITVVGTISLQYLNAEETEARIVKRVWRDAGLEANPMKTTKTITEKEDQ